MISLRISRSSTRGVILVIVLAVLVIMGSLGVAVLLASSGRHIGVNTLEARLEAGRIGRAYADIAASAAMDALAADSTPSTPSTIAFQPNAWTIVSTNLNAGSGIPLGLLSAPRGTSGGADRDAGVPGLLSWVAPFSEVVRTQGTINLVRESSTTATTLAQTIPVEFDIWRIPCAAVRFTVSEVAPIIDFPIVASGPAVCVPAISGSNIPNLTADLYLNSASARMTAGANPGNRITTVYGLNGSNPGFERVFDSTDDAFAGVVTVDVGGTQYLGINLATYRGPSALTIRGAAVQNGFVLLGNGDPSSSTISQALSIAVDGPVFLIGSNYRYVLAATTTAEIRIYSQASYDSSTNIWTASTSTASASVDWAGHLFVSAMDFRLRTEENWSGKNFTLHGSLHVRGGHLAMTGAGAGTLSTLRIVEPDWTAIDGANPFGNTCRHESVAFLPLQ